MEWEWRAHSTQIAKINQENEQNCKDFQIVTNTIEEVILKNNHQFAKDWETTQSHINQRADKHQQLKNQVLKLEGLSGLQQTTINSCSIR